MSRHLNVIIVPDEGGKPRRLKLSVFWLRFGSVTGILLMLMIVVALVSYSGLARKSLDYARLKKENDRLEIENQRIIRVAREVDESRKILAQIIRSLGGHLDLGRPVEEGDSISLSHALQDREISLSNEDFLDKSSFAVERIMSYGMPTQMPIEGFISQKFFEDHLFPERSHRGIDIAGKTSSSIVAAAYGRVVFEGWTPYYGKCMMIAHQGGYLTFYGHNQLNIKKVRDEVKRGEPIALLGNSGRSSAPHLHFEIWKDGVPVDPQEFLQMELAMNDGM